MSIRIYYNHSIISQTPFLLSSHDIHYVSNVMRLKAGDHLLCFNGSEEWNCNVQSASKKSFMITPISINRALIPSRYNITLFQGIVKHAAMHEVISNATQLGIDTVVPVTTRRTVANSPNIAKLQTIAIQSACQCNRIDVPTVRNPSKILNAIGTHSGLVIFANEHSNISMIDSFNSIRDRMSSLEYMNIALLIGPEGGFDKQEVNDVLEHGNVLSIGLGGNILRSQTATTVALSLLHSILSLRY